MALAIDIECREEQRAARIALAGRLDTLTASDLERVVEPMLDGRYDGVVFDLAGLEFISSAGIRVLVQVRKALRAQQGSVMIVNAQPPIQKVFEIVKALPGLSVFRNDAEMDDYLAKVQSRFRKS